MNLARAGAAPFHVDSLELAKGHVHSRGAVAECLEVNGERAVTVKLAEGADAIAGAAGKDGEFGTIGDLLAALEFGRSGKGDTEAGGGSGGRRGKVDGDRRHRGLILHDAVFEDGGDRLRAFVE